MNPVNPDIYLEMMHTIRKLRSKTVLMVFWGLWVFWGLSGDSGATALLPFGRMQKAV
jgi:hypothetical protein